MPPSGTQSIFTRALVSFDDVPPELRLAGDAASQALRFGVHRNAILASLTTVLAARFPVVAALVGESYFRAMAAQFVLENPPSSPVLLEYGGAFPEFVATFPPAHDIPYLACVASLEWARHEALHAADAEPLTVQALAAVAPERLGGVRLILHPATRLHVSAYPAVTLWRIHVEDLAAPQSLSGGEAAMIVRPDLSARVLDLTDSSFAFLTSLSQGHSLSDAVLAAHSVDAAFDLAATLALVFSAGAIAGVVHPSSDLSGA